MGSNAALLSTNDDEGNAMLGTTELILLLMILSLPYGFWMTFDAVARPAEQFRFGPKPLWLVMLIASNPLLAKYLAPYEGVVDVPVFFVLALTYHVTNRRGTSELRAQGSRPGR